VKVERVDPPSSGAPEAIPPYERLSGMFYGELDPADPKNAVITDIQLAARNARGKVEYVGTFSLMKPVDMSKVSVTRPGAVAGCLILQLGCSWLSDQRSASLTA